MTDRLREYPFCGGEAVIIEANRPYGPITYFVTCVDCGIETARISRTKEKVIEIWNTRNPMDRIVEPLEERLSYLNNILHELEKEKIIDIPLILKTSAYKHTIDCLVDAIEIVKGGVE